MFSNWSVVINFSCYKRGRILIVWCFRVFDMNVVFMLFQVMYISVVYILVKKKWLFIIVYGFNQVFERKVLWEELCDIDKEVDSFWIMVGDYNNLFNIEDRMGVSVMLYEILLFKDCVEFNWLQDILVNGCFYIQNNK